MRRTLRIAVTVAAGAAVMGIGSIRTASAQGRWRDRDDHYYYRDVNRDAIDRDIQRVQDDEARLARLRDRLGHERRERDRMEYFQVRREIEYTQRQLREDRRQLREDRRQLDQGRRYMGQDRRYEHRSGYRDRWW